MTEEEHKEETPEEIQTVQDGEEDYGFSIGKVILLLLGIPAAIILINVLVYFFIFVGFILSGSTISK